MNEQNTFHCVILRRFFDRFQNVTYQGVPIAKYVYYQLLRDFYAHPAWAKEKLPYWEDEVSRLAESGVYGWSDEPYSFEPHPDGTILMRGGFGDIASLHLPKERFCLLSPRTEVNVIKANRPDLDVHDIESYFRENPKAAAGLFEQIATVIREQPDDPILGSPDLLEWFRRKVPEMVRVLDAVQGLFEKKNIGAVLTISSIFWLDSALNLIAKANRVPSFTLQHGLIDDLSLLAHLPVLATQKMVWGESTLGWYQKYGYPESRISVVGSPRYDIIFNGKWCGKEKLRQRVGAGPSQKIMVYATGSARDITAPIVLEGLKAIPEVFLIISLHPSEDQTLDQYQKISEGYGNCKIVRGSTEISLYDSLSGADFFITHCSTAALEAMLFQLPVITVEAVPPHFSYGDAGASLKVTSAGELAQVVNRLINDEAFRAGAIGRYREFLASYCRPDGCASKRLFDKIERLSRAGGTF
jgi:hypothetical protein